MRGGLHATKLPYCLFAKIVARAVRGARAAEVATLLTPLVGIVSREATNFTILQICESVSSD
jgi:hypothetical protein